jgi:hypothetical protein
MGVQQKSAAMRIGVFVGHAYQGYASFEGKILAPLPRAISLSLRIAIRAGTTAILLYFLFVPTLFAMCTVAVLSKIRSGTTSIADLVPQQSSLDVELFEGNEGFGLYKDGVRVG